MPLNIDDVNFTGMNFSRLEPPNYNFGQPQRKLPLNTEEQETVIEAISLFESSGINHTTIFDLFKDWQSDKTKSVKRFVLSISFILSLSIFAGVNLVEIDLFGVSVADGMENIFLFALIVILICSFFYYEYLTRTDQKIHEAKVDSVKIGTEKYLNLVDEIDRIIEKKKIKSIETLFDDFKWTMHQSTRDLEAYNALKFFRNKLEKPKKSYEWGESIERIVIYILGITALISILSSF